MTYPLYFQVTIEHFELETVKNVYGSGGQNSSGNILLANDIAIAKNCQGDVSVNEEKVYKVETSSLSIDD